MKVKSKIIDSDMADASEKENFKEALFLTTKKLKSMEGKIPKGAVLLCQNSYRWIVEIISPDEPIKIFKVSWVSASTLMRNWSLSQNPKYGFIIYDRDGILYCETQGSKVIMQKGFSF